ncbi:MAG TPA: hypothetical protein VFL85_02805, partial [Candidatus Saccharimonadales bacterium]|nr:hypothetical protein [Candidatus Saccharimonadales bacterium]
MTATFDGLRRKGYLAAAAIATLAIGMASVLPGFASAAQVTGRSITMSDSTAGATGTVYALTMTMPTAVQSMVIDFCAESPIIGSSTCTAPTGMSAASAAYTAVNPGGNTPVGSGGPGSAPTGWSKGTFGASQLKLTASSATTAGTKYTFYFTNIKNPTSTGAFYARVYTYTGTTYGGYTSVSSLGTVQDSGGFALSTANNISVSATVQETLTFCISDVAPGSNCAGTNPPVVKLGTGNPVTIDSAAVYDNSAASTSYMQISTNAVSGAIVNMKSNYASCNGLSSDGGTTCGIPGSAGALAAGT